MCGLVLGDRLPGQTIFCKSIVTKHAPMGIFGKSEAAFLKIDLLGQRVKETVRQSLRAGVLGW